MIELLVAVAILLLIMSVLFAMSGQFSDIWRKTTGKIEEFRDARNAFESMTRRIGMATLNTYWDYDDPAAPTRYIRQSELRFICGKTETLAGAPPAPRRWPTQGIFFQAPLGFVQAANAAGLENLLNTWGYFIEFGDDSAERPPILGPTTPPLRYRYRLCEFMEPSDSFSIYTYTSGLDGTGKPKSATYTGKDWFTAGMGLPDPPASPARPVHVLAENVIALVFLPKLSQQQDPSGVELAPNYAYDSTDTQSNPLLNPKNQLPPIVQVTMVTLDEASALRIAQGSTMPDLGLDSLFSSASNMTADLQTLQKTLIDRHLNFRVFTINVSIKGAKWSQDEAD